MRIMRTYSCWRSLEHLMNEPLKGHMHAHELLAINTIRTLSIDAIEQAKSGHPGMPMGSATMAYVLWTQHMRHHPEVPTWMNRDRFVLSAGHGSMLLYSLLHLFGYADTSLDQLKQFRQWGSKTPGHPEYRHTAGVDATTGPLGQGFAMAVGMAMAEAHLGAVYNRPAYDIIDHHTFVICGDGDLMEGVTGEAASLAGHLRLKKLIVLYDSNDISLDGDLNLAYSEDVALRFRGYGWHVLHVADGNDTRAIDEALIRAKQQDRPTLIEIKTVIGYGSPNKQGRGGHAGPHGSPLGTDEATLTKEYYGWEHEPFVVPPAVAEQFVQHRQRCGERYAAWQQQFQDYEKAYPEVARALLDAVEGVLPPDWESALPHEAAHTGAVATRATSGHVLNALSLRVPTLFGGSADLESSTNTHMKGAGVFSAQTYAGRNVYFGVREFAMAAAMNGVALHGGVRPFGGTFFVFADYLRPAIRLAALQQLPVIYVFTHDSIAVGEDGPTHEPVEHLASLRSMIGVTVMRPADANETTHAWRYALLQRDRPVALILTRQPLPVLSGAAKGAQEGVFRGAYVVADAPEGTVPHVQLIATGSEVHLAVSAAQQLISQHIYARVISMPSMDVFESQPVAYQQAVILPAVKKRLIIEMGSPFGWHRYAGEQGEIMGIGTYGASAPGSRVIEEYGFTVSHVLQNVQRLLATDTERNGQP